MSDPILRLKGKMIRTFPAIKPPCAEHYPWLSHGEDRWCGGCGRLIERTGYEGWGWVLK